MMVPIGSRMSQMPLGYEMNGALDDLNSARHHGQCQDEGNQY